MDVDFSSLAIFILVLLSIVAVLAVLGNGFVLGIVARFKTFRTFPNILIANLALIDFFNALINIPIYLLWAVLNVKWFTGKAVATISLLLSRLFVILNIVSMVVLLVNVFLAIELDLKYYTWKTNEKAVKIVVVEWVVCVIATALLSWFDSGIDLQDASVLRYRRSMLNKSQKVFAVVIAVFIFSAITFGVLVFCSIQRKKRQRKRLNIPRLQAEARLQCDVQAVKTVIITVFAFIACYISPVCFAILAPPEPDDTTMDWRGHIAYFSNFLSSGINPVIYSFRARRFRRALKQLLQDPCGKTAFREKKQEQRVKKNVPHQNAGVAEEGKEIAIELGEFRQDPSACSSKSCTRQLGKKGGGCRREENRKERGRCPRNQIMPFSSQDAQRPINSRLAWIDNHPADSAGTSSGKERPKCREDYTQNKITMKVHSEPKDRSSKQKNEENLTTPNEIGSKGECNDSLRSLDNPANQKTIKIPVVMEDNNGDAIVKTSKTDPVSHLSNPIIMDSPAAIEQRHPTRIQIKTT